MLSLIIVITLIIGAINVINYKNVIADAHTTLQIIAENKGRFPNSDSGRHDMDIVITPETPFESRYFSVEFEDGKLKDVNTTSIAAVDDDQAIGMANEVINSGNVSGFISNYRYLVSIKDETTRVIFLDCTRALGAANDFLFSSISISLLGLLTMFMIIWFISDRIVSPIIKSHEKQKRFITDAGHDIKTPITIIDADAELLEMEFGESEWLEDIKKQTSRLTSLTNDLIYLSRMEEQENEPHIDFPLSEIAEEVVNSFAAPAKSKEIDLNLSVDPALFYHGDEKSIRKLFFLLLDNAVKYSPAGESIDVSVKKLPLGVIIKISNTTRNLTNDMVTHMFDRFYRSDSARSTNGGFGIGLSVANAIVASHKGKISAHKDGDILVFDIFLP